MSDPREPVRWLDDPAQAPEEFERCVRADEARAPSAPSLERMMSALAVEVGQPELLQAYREVAGKPASVLPHARRLSLAKLLWGLTTLAILGAAAFVAQRSRAPEERPRSSMRAPVAKAPAATNAPELNSESGPPPAPVASAQADSSAPSIGPAPPRVRPSPRAKLQVDDPPAELALLEPAQRVLASDPARALALAEQHRARFPRGQFVQEREMLAIEALLGLGRNTEAAARGRSFARRHPDSSHLPRLRDLLRNHP